MTLDLSNFSTFDDCPGAQHIVHWPDANNANLSDLYKEPRETCEFTRKGAQQALDFANKWFGDFAVDTDIIPHPDNDRYLIKQEIINGKMLADLNPLELSKYTLGSLEEVLNIYQKILDEQGFAYDVIGEQPFHRERFVLDDFYFLLRVFRTSIFDSTNFMVDSNNNLRLIDNVFMNNPLGDNVFREDSKKVQKLRKWWGNLNQGEVLKQIKKTG